MEWLTWNGEEIVQKVRTAVMTAIEKAGEDLRDRSVNRAPIDTGKLRQSCVADKSELNDLVVAVGYTKEVDHYAMVQHERLDFNHPRGGEAKFLENPFNENKEQYQEFIAKEITEVLR